MAHMRCMLDKQGYTRTNTPTRPVTHTHARTHRQIYNTFLLFHGNNGYANVPQYYVVRTLRVLFSAQYVHCVSCSVRSTYIACPVQCAVRTTRVVRGLWTQFVTRFVCWVAECISVEELPIMGLFFIPLLTWMLTEHCLNGDWQGKTEVVGQ